MERPDAAGSPSEDRNHVLRELQEWLEKPMMVLAILWLALFIYEVLRGLNPVLEVAGYIIWGAFVLELVVDLMLAPSRAQYFRRNWLKVVAAVAPGLRILRVFAVARAARLARLGMIARTTRSLRLVRVVGSINRAMNTFGRSMDRRGFGYVLALTAVVLLLGSAGMYAFECRGVQAGGITSFTSALWWTAMLMTTMGSDFWPRTPEGRALCFLISLYALAVFGYFTAALATYFVGRDAESNRGADRGEQVVAQLRAEIASLRHETDRLIAARRS